MSSLRDKLCEFRIIKLRDQDAFSEFYQRHYPRIQRFVQARVESKETSEEVADEAFLEVWRYIYVEQQTVEHLPALLLTITRRLVVNHYRKRKAPEEPIEEQKISDQGSFLTELEVTGDTETIKHALDNIRSEYREVIALRFLDEFEIREIAAVLHKSPGAVRVLIHRALRALRDELQK
jgi:RNA polymerase sigma-70 factor, ECF subfamily